MSFAKSYVRFSANWRYARFDRSNFVQEGFTRLGRGITASLALAMPVVGIYLPCYDIFRNIMEEYMRRNTPSLTPYVPLVGSAAHSLACITCYLVELARTRMQAFKETQTGVKQPGVWKTLFGDVTLVRSTNNLQNCKLIDASKYALSCVLLMKLLRFLVDVNTITL